MLTRPTVATRAAVRPDLFVRAMVRGLDALLADLDGGPEGSVVWVRPAG